MDKTITSTRLREAMEELGYNQTDLVVRTGLSKSAISQYITGKFEPKQRALYKLAETLNVSESWLMGLDVPRERMKVVLPAKQDENSTNAFVRIEGKELNHFSHCIFNDSDYIKLGNVDLKNGDIGVFVYKDKMLFRRIYISEDEVILTNCDPVVSPIVIDKRDFHQYEVVGVVVKESDNK